MFAVLSNPTYARLFTAQLVALLGTGLMTIALGLLAFEMAGEDAGAVLGTAYLIKMIAYVGLSPVAQALTARLPRKLVLVTADVIRALVALSLPFIDAIWQIYVLIFVLQAASASFTPAFQALIPDVLPDETDYTNALSLSRLAYELENLFSPVIAGLLLLVISFHGLFVGTGLGFAVSSALVIWTTLPRSSRSETHRGFADRVTLGSRIYLSTPRLRGLLALNLVAASSGAFVLINSVVVVRGIYGLSAPMLAVTMGAFGTGAMISALSLPRLLKRIGDRPTMMAGASLMAIVTVSLGLWVSTFGWPVWAALLGVWALLGLGYAAVLTPGGRLLKKSAHAADRPALFTAQFALSHLCWLVTYPVAGWGGRELGLPPTLLILGALGIVGLLSARHLWPASQSDAPWHDHKDLPSDHPHLRQYPLSHGGHSHDVVIDEEHHHWPV